MPTSSPLKWYTRKPPTLQIEILRSIATEGPLSKKMATDLTGSHYPDVSDAFGKLESKKLILGSDFLHNLRDKRFYKLSRRGFESFIDLKPTPEEFWKALRWFCRLSTKEMDWDKFNTLYHRFQNGYLGYTPRHGYFFQFRFVDKLFKKWLRDNEMIYDPARDNKTKLPGFIPSQRVLESLGMNRLVTFDQLCQHIEDQAPVFEKRYLAEHKHLYLGRRAVQEEEIKHALDYYTLSPNCEKPYHPPRPDPRLEFDQRMDDYVELIQHLVVIYRYDKDGEKNYELSLFGIALLLSLKAHYYLNPENLFYNTIESDEYCKRLAMNYNDKLPLVFGKWKSLTKGNQDEVTSEILSQLFQENNRTARIELSVLLGGVKEYYDGIGSLVRQEYLKLKEIHDSGDLLRQQLAKSKDIYQVLLSHKLDEIYDSLRRRDLQKFMEGLWENPESDSLEKGPSSIYADELMNMETAYADEITFLFYIFLYVHDPRVLRFESVYPTYFPSTFEVIDSRKTYPLKLFGQILSEHQDVGTLFIHWITDSIKCQNEVGSLMSHLKEYVTKNEKNLQVSSRGSND